MLVEAEVQVTAVPILLVLVAQEAEVPAVMRLLVLLAHQILVVVADLVVAEVLLVDQV
jgi:hypothetical protein